MQHSWECLTLANVPLSFVCVQVCLGVKGDRSTCPTAAPCVRGYGGKRYGILYIFCTVLYYVVCAHAHVCLHVCIFLKCLWLHSFVFRGPRLPVQVFTNGNAWGVSPFGCHAGNHTLYPVAYCPPHGAVSQVQCGIGVTWPVVSTHRRSTAHSMLHLAGVVQSVFLAVVVEWVMEWCCVLLPNPCPALVSAVPAPHAPQQLTILYHNYNTQPISLFPSCHTHHPLIVRAWVRVFPCHPMNTSVTPPAQDPPWHWEHVYRRVRVELLDSGLLYRVLLTFWLEMA